MLLFSFLFVSQAFWLLAYLVLGGDTIVWRSIYLPDLKDGPIAVCISLIIVPFSCFLVAVLLERRENNEKSYSFGKEIPFNKTLNVCLAFLASSSIYAYLATLLEAFPLLSALMNYIFRGAFLCPALIGYSYKEYPIPFRIFIAAMAVSAPISFVEGSRGVLILPFVYFFIGFTARQNQKRRATVAVIVLILAIPLFYLSGLLGRQRYEVRYGAASTFSEKASQIFSALAYGASESTVMENVMEGINRMIVWASLVVVVESPTTIPYRGFENFMGEIEVNNRSTIRSANQTEYNESIIITGLGYAAASIYGIEIGYGNTVPFPIIAESWSQGGPIASVIFALIFCTSLCLGERLLRWHFSSRPELLILALTLLASIPLVKAAEASAIYCLRNLLMATIFWIVVLEVVDKLVSGRRRAGRMLQLETMT